MISRIILSHRRHGAGPAPVLLLHGFLGSGRNLGGLARRLAAGDPGLSVIALDLTGHGSSPPLPSGANVAPPGADVAPKGADLATLAGDVLATADALGLRAPVPIVGHSLGGRVALRAASLAPQRIANVVLLDIGPSGVLSTETARVVELLLAAPPSGSRETFRGHFRSGGLDDAVVEWLMLNLVAADGQYRWAIDRAALAALHARTSAEDLWGVVEGQGLLHLTCLRGGRSGYVTDADAARLAAAGRRLVTIEGAGHFLHVERPAEVLAAVRDALTSRAPPPG
ncbi:MAG TPA: alpha/beta hydrolase [Candidatus Binatia bacterium]|nr:alpha/beta hydrolase [Candidatus Binatia bacterium]